jgi:hypothetical protein
MRPEAACSGVVTWITAGTLNCASTEVAVSSHQNINHDRSGLIRQRNDWRL